MRRSFLFCLPALACSAILVPAAQAQVTPPERSGTISIFSGPEDDDDALVRLPMPIGDIEGWAGRSDYPDAALAANIKGNVLARVRVSARDAIEGCGIVEPSAPEPLREVTCRLIRERGRFVHALSVDGRPVDADAHVQFYFAVADIRNPMMLYAPGAPDEPPGGYPYTPTLKLLKKPDWAAFAPAGKPDGEVIVSVGVFAARGALPERRDCIASGTASNALLEAATCEAARAADYAILGQRPYGVIKMLVRWHKGKARHMLPKGTQGTPLAITGGEAAAQLPGGATGSQPAAAVATFRANGQVGCRISSSSGSDATDLAICTHLRKLRFTPETDLFGRNVTVTRDFRYEP